MTAFLASRAAAWAQSRAAESSLPVGSPITIISDETVDPRVRPYSQFRAHLRDPLELGDTLVATAGTPARLIVLAKDTAGDGTTSFHIAITGLHLGPAGTLPVRPQTPIVAAITAGMAIPATTLAAIGFEAGKVRVLVPLPFTLSNETPNPIYTPAPLRTAAPILNARPHRGSRSTPAPSPSPPAPAVSPLSAPAASASPTAPPSGAPPTTPIPPGPIPTPS